MFRLIISNLAYWKKIFDLQEMVLYKTLWANPKYLECNLFTETNECASSPCLNGGSCVDGDNEYACNCKQGFSGKDCQLSSSTCKFKNYLNLKMFYSSL